jgi:hypothetical protein
MNVFLLEDELLRPAGCCHSSLLFCSRLGVQAQYQPNFSGRKYSTLLYHLGFAFGATVLAVRHLKSRGTVSFSLRNEDKPGALHFNHEAWLLTPCKRFP